MAYKPTEEAVSTPRRLRLPNSKPPAFVSIGGKINLGTEEKPKWVREATQAELGIFYKNGLIGLIEDTADANAKKGD